MSSNKSYIEELEQQEQVKKDLIEQEKRIKESSKRLADRISTIMSVERSNITFTLKKLKEIVAKWREKGPKDHSIITVVIYANNEDETEENRVTEQSVQKLLDKQLPTSEVFVLGTEAQWMSPRFSDEETSFLNDQIEEEYRKIDWRLSSKFRDAVSTLLELKEAVMVQWLGQMGKTSIGTVKTFKEGREQLKKPKNCF